MILWVNLRNFPCYSLISYFYDSTFIVYNDNIFSSSWILLFKYDVTAYKFAVWPTTLSRNVGRFGIESSHPHSSLATTQGDGGGTSYQLTNLFLPKMDVVLNIKLSPVHNFDPNMIVKVIEANSTGIISMRQF
jgi:hypothetical protein